MIWRDGRLVSEDPGCLPGDEVEGVFTTAGCEGGRVLLWPRHRARLTASLRALDSRVQLDLPGAEAMHELLAANGLYDAARLRLAAWRTAGGWRLEAAAAEVPEAGPRREPAALELVRWPAAPPLAGHKCLARKVWDEAGRRARGAGADDALLVDSNEQVLETSVANVWVIFGDRAVTPPAPELCLPGVMRGWLLEHLPDLGVRATAEPLRLDSLLSADELWISNAVVGLRRVVCIGDTSWSSWPLFDRIADRGVPAPGWAYLPSSGSK